MEEGTLATCHAAPYKCMLCLQPQQAHCHMPDISRGLI